MIFRKAQYGEEDSILQLYHSVVGTEFCVWDEFYPCRMQVDQDLESGELYVLADDERLIGAISIIPEHDLEELDELTFWEGQEPAFSFARVVIIPEMQGSGLAAALVEKVEEVIQSRGGNCVRILAAVGNLPAIKTYERLGYRTAGTCFLFGHDYLGMEKILTYL